MLLFCCPSIVLAFFQLCCVPAKATVVLETAASSLVSSPLLLTTNPALRVDFCPHASSLTRRIHVFFIFYCFEDDFLSSLTSGTETGGLCSTSARLTLQLHLLSFASTIFWTFFFPTTFCFFGFWAKLQHFSVVRTSESGFWPASKSNCEITSS